MNLAILAAKVRKLVADGKAAPGAAAQATLDMDKLGDVIDAAIAAARRAKGGRVLN